MTLLVSCKCRLQEIVPPQSCKMYFNFSIDARINCVPRLRMILELLDLFKEIISEQRCNCWDSTMDEIVVGFFLF